MRFAVLKGIQGFGDRLQCLLQAIRYAQHTARILVIDWRDTDWSHDPSQFGFEDFFRLTGVPSFGINEFCEYVSSRSDRLSVVPNAWKNKLTDWGYQNWIYSEIFNHPRVGTDEVLNQCFWEIIEYRRPDFDADVVVIPGVYRRFCDYSDVRWLQPSRWLDLRLRSLLQPHHELRRFQYDVVHLRGGSKSWAGGYVPLKGLAEHIEKTWPDEENYFQRMHLAYQNMVQSMPSLPLLLVSDSERLSNSWQQRFGACLTIPTFNGILEESGTHKLTAQQLQQHTISKADLNVELLRDFVLLSNARSITWDGISLFSKAAVGCKKTGVSLLWLDEAAASEG